MHPSLPFGVIAKPPGIRICRETPYFCTAAAGLFCTMAALSFLVCPGAAQVSTDSPAQSSSITRPCTDVAPDPKTEKNPRIQETDAARIPEGASPACLEVKASGLEVQQFLQSFVREQAWTIGQQHSGGDTWTFVRWLDKDELARVAKANIAGGRIAWKEGKGFVTVRTSDAKEGFTRVQISARYQGRGETKERFARPTDIWPLISNGTLESGMIAALESHFISHR